MTQRLQEAAQASQPLGEKINEVSLKLKYSNGTEGKSYSGTETQWE